MQELRQLWKVRITHKIDGKGFLHTIQSRIDWFTNVFLIILSCDEANQTSPALYMC